MRIEHEPNMAALRRDWLGAWLVGAVGVALVLAVVLIGGQWFADRPAPVSSTAGAPPSVSAAAPSETIVVPTTSTADARREENIAVCTVALQTAQKEGILPAFATLASDDLQNTNVQGRYICLAKTDAAKYSIDFDLTCTNLGADHCISLYTISQAGGGGVIYQRK